jgi:hypothetical protein
MLQCNVALQFGQEMFLEFAYGALAVKQVAHEEQRQCAETEEGDAKRPLVTDRVEEHQRVHEDGKASGLNEHKGGGENGELQLTAFEMIQFFAIQSAHDFLFGDPDLAAVSTCLGSCGSIS